MAATTEHARSFKHQGSTIKIRQEQNAAIQLYQASHENHLSKMKKILKDTQEFIADQLLALQQMEKAANEDRWKAQQEKATKNQAVQCEASEFQGNDDNQSEEDK